MCLLKFIYVYILYVYEEEDDKRGACGMREENEWNKRGNREERKRKTRAKRKEKRKEREMNVVQDVVAVCCSVLQYIAVFCGRHKERTVVQMCGAAHYYNTRTTQSCN